MVGHANSLTNWSTTQFIVDPSAASGAYTTIGAANTAAIAAGGGVIFVRAGTYTESFALGAGVSLNAYGSIPAVFGPPTGAEIDGTITLSNSGQMSITGISITNSSGGPCVTATGTNGFLAFIQNCIIVGGAGAAIQGSNGNANILFNSCDIVSTSGDFLSCTGAGPQFTNCKFISDGGSAGTTYSTSGGGYKLCDIGGPITLSTSGETNFEYCDIPSITTSGSASFDVAFCNFQNGGTSITMAGTGNCKISQSNIANSGGSAISIGSGTELQIDQCSINSSGATYAITGTGSLSYALLELTGSATLLDPGLNISVKPTLPLATTSSTSVPGLAYFNSSQFSVSSAGEVGLLASAIPWTDESSTFSAQIGNGYFITGGSPTCEMPPNLSFPAVPVQGDTIQFVVHGSGATVTLQAETGQTITIGNASSSVGGTATSSLNGDSAHFVYRSGDSSWIATSFIGTWTLA